MENLLQTRQSRNITDRRKWTLSQMIKRNRFTNNWDGTWKDVKRIFMFMNICSYTLYVCHIIKDRRRSCIRLSLNSSAGPVKWFHPIFQFYSLASLELIPPVNPVSCNVFQKSLCIHTMKFVAVAKTPVHVYKATCAHATINRKSWKIVADAVSCSIFFLSNPFRACWNHILTFFLYRCCCTHVHIVDNNT